MTSVQKFSYYYHLEVNFILHFDLTCGDRSDEHGGELDDGRVAELPALVGVRPHATRPDRRRVELRKENVIRRIPQSLIVPCAWNIIIGSLLDTAGSLQTAKSYTCRLQNGIR